MQQKDVLTELYSYISSDPKPPVMKETECTSKYLKVCNLIVEKGFLSHNKVSSREAGSTECKSWLQIFSNWLDEVYRKGTNALVT